jgi:hypothetical protein
MYTPPHLLTALHHGLSHVKAVVLLAQTPAAHLCALQASLPYYSPACLMLYPLPPPGAQGHG